MKFLTEDDLRMAYQDSPFDSFAIDQTRRLTPGARSFLSDRNIKLIDERDPHQLKQKRAIVTKSEPSFSKESRSWKWSLPWHSYRCRLLKVACHFRHKEGFVAEEIASIERCLATWIEGGDISCFLTTCQDQEATLDKSALLANLSSLSLLLPKARVEGLIALYDCYFSLEELIENAFAQRPECLDLLSDRLGRLLMEYLKNCKEVGDVSD
ncbi:hypothetical protein [Streptococcus dysgalactiae]|uniref:hypothetical protein n=1 Tax=Streptococcus dysgalactiae TaxID=1334 RepID=UPI0013FCFBEE|nr:hypothetical protein [Streptococcus dysgalactiae]